MHLFDKAACLLPLASSFPSLYTHTSSGSCPPEHLCTCSLLIKRALPALFALRTHNCFWSASLTGLLHTLVVVRKQAVFICLALGHSTVVDLKCSLVEAWTRELLIAGAPNKCRRRGGWRVKARQYKRWRSNDDEILARRDRWEYDTSQCNWWSLLHVSEDSDEYYWCEQFRDQFGIPRAVFDYLMGILSDVDGLRDGKTVDIGVNRKRGKREGKPLCIRLLSTLRYLVSGSSLKKVSEEAVIGPGCLRRSFWRIVNHMVDNHYSEHVYMPRTSEEVRQTEERFSRMGFPGAITDVDGVQIPWHACPTAYAPTNTGKEGSPTLGFLEYVGPNGEIQHIHGPEHGVHMPLAL